MCQHVDDDFFLGAVVALSVDGFAGKHNVLQYFCFPELGIAIPLCHGELLLFNPRVPHCLSSRVSGEQDVIVASMYIKTAVVGGNDKNVDVTAPSNLRNNS